MSDKNSKTGKSNFVLNDMVKRKILDMYKISKSDEQNISKENKSSEKINSNK